MEQTAVRLPRVEGTLVCVLSLLLALLVSAPPLLITAYEDEQDRRDCVAWGGGEWVRTPEGGHFCVGAAGAVRHD